MSYFEAVNFHPNVALRSHSVEAVREYVAENIGFSVLFLKPPFSASYNGKKLVYKPLPQSGLFQPQIISGCLKNVKGSRLKKVEAFMAECRAFFSSSDIDKYFIN